VAGISLSQAETALAAWLAADAALAGGAQSVRINTGGTDRQVTAADAAEIRNNIEYWNNWCVRLSPRSNGRTGIPAIGVIPT
jgi:hypothetical protein